MRLLISGGAGFVGANVVRELLAEGASVRVLARPRSDRRALTGLRVEILEGDLLDVASVGRAVAGVETVFHDPTHGRYFIAEIDDRVVGSLLITYEWSDWRSGMVWWIQSVYVRPQNRRQRIYAGLYEHVKQIVESQSYVRGIRLYVDRRNVPAQQVYARLGMRHLGP